MIRRGLVLPGLLIPIAALLACGGGPGSAGRVEDSAAGTVALGLGMDQPYRPVTVSEGATLAGAITAHTPLTLTQVSLADSSDACGAAPASSTGDTVLANALVWVEGVETGKPLPELRRERITVEDCRITPRIVAVTAGSTINVFSRDPFMHEMRFYRENHGEPVAHLLMVDDGQVIPSETIAEKAGIVEARCTEHPHLRGFVAVFDHPYFAVTDAKGSFVMERLPPGTYTVKVWHEALDRPIERRVVLGKGGTGRLDLKLGDAPPPAPIARTGAGATAAAELGPR